MQHMTSAFALLALTALVAAAESSPELACRQLRDGLARELAALESVQDAASAAAQLPELQAALDALAALDRSYEAERALWGYIDNTEGVKLPLLELLQKLTREFSRLEAVSYYGNEELRACLAPQVTPPKKTPAAE